MDSPCENCGAGKSHYMGAGRWSCLPAPYEKPTLQRVTLHTAAGHELDVMAETLYGLRRRPAIPGSATIEPDYSLRMRCLQLAPPTRPMMPLREMPNDDPEAAPPLITAVDANRERPQELVRIVGIDHAVTGSEPVVVNVIDNGDVIGQVVVDPQALYPNVTEGIVRIVADVTRMVRENCERSRRFDGGINVSQTFEDAGSIGSYLQTMKELGRSYGEALNRAVAALAEVEEVEAALPPTLVGTRWSMQAVDGGVTAPMDARVHYVALVGPDVEELSFVVASGQPTSVHLTRQQFLDGRIVGTIRAFDPQDETIADLVLARKPCESCGELPPKGHAAHACVDGAAAYHDQPYEIQIAWLRMREAETGQRVACCTIGGIHWMAARPCPIHEKPRAPAPWVPSWDRFGFET